jgi:hypothetical protein
MSARCLNQQSLLHYLALSGEYALPKHLLNIRTELSAYTPSLMYQDSRDYWMLGLYPTSDILQETTFRKRSIVQFSGEGKKGTNFEGSVHNTYH